ncbi:PPPDE putative peptidase domain-containing protein [Pelagophyceae sp. CCMP2097]|nr:PPPDE putative peptidase domain-containing protein [Pelagophyceae sp. CCMP2097]
MDALAALFGFADSPRGRRLATVNVYLNVYDFLRMQSATSDALAVLGLGVHHTGLQVDDVEFTYNSRGIVRMPTLQMPFCRLNDSLFLGEYPGSKDDLEQVLDELRVDFCAGGYDLLRRNCNHFTRALAARLVGAGRVPRWVNRSAETATFLGFKPPKRRTPEPPARPTSLRDGAGDDGPAPTHGETGSSASTASPPLPPLSPTRRTTPAAVPSSAGCAEADAAEGRGKAPPWIVGRGAAACGAERDGRVK